jgi:hypothetical protein
LRLAFGAGYGMVWTAGLCWLAGAAAGFTMIAAGLAAFRVPPGAAAPRAGKMPGLRAVAMNRDLIGAAAAVVTAGLSTGVCALLVPALLHAAGASAGQIGLYFAAAGIMFAAGSAVTAAAGRRPVSLPVTCGGMLVLAAALTPAVVGATPLLLLVRLCVTTAGRSVLWTVSYSLAAAAGQGRAGQGSSGEGLARTGQAPGWVPRSGCSTSSGRRRRSWARSRPGWPPSTPARARRSG